MNDSMRNDEHRERVRRIALLEAQVYTLRQELRVVRWERDVARIEAAHYQWQLRQYGERL